MSLRWEPVGSYHEMISQIHHIIQFISENNEFAEEQCQVVDLIRSIPMNIYIDYFVPTLLRKAYIHSFSVSRNAISIGCQLNE